MVVEPTPPQDQGETAGARALGERGADTTFVEPSDAGAARDVRIIQSEKPIEHHNSESTEQSVVNELLADRIKRSDRWMIGLTAVVAFGGILSALIF